MKVHDIVNEIKKGQKDSNGYTKCWPGKHAEGTKKGKNGGRVRNCLPNESVDEAANAAQQAAIAINMKKKGKKPKNESIGNEKYVLYVDGKPMTEYENLPDLNKDLGFLKKKFPNKDFVAKKEVCRMVQVEDASGYIPKNNKEAKDPRYVMSQTVDVKPGEDKRQAAKFGFKIQAGGQAPLLRADGKA